MQERSPLCIPTPNCMVTRSFLSGAAFPAIAIASYFDDAEVIELTESKLVIYSPSPFRKDVIVKRYIDQIREAMRDQFQTEVEVVVLDETELPQYSKNKKNRNFVEFNSQYTFDKFVVGSSNQHAFSAARAVADNPADAYNPLFIYGESGLGKTHLLYAIANQIQREHPDYNIVSSRGDQFTNELIDAVRSGKNFEFRDKYRNADLFLMDDIQFIAGKDAAGGIFPYVQLALREQAPDRPDVRPRSRRHGPSGGPAAHPLRSGASLWTSSRPITRRASSSREKALSWASSCRRTSWTTLPKTSRTTSARSRAPSRRSRPITT